MKRIVVILSLISCISCEKSDDVTDQYNLDVGIEFSIQNSNNEDLLDPQTPEHINTNQIKLFYLLEGKKQEVYDSNMDNPRNFLIYKHENEYRIGITPNFSEESSKPVTYIQWNDADIDTIEVSYERTPRAVIQKEIWLNGDLIWERSNNQNDPFFVLTK